MEAFRDISLGTYVVHWVTGEFGFLTQEMTAFAPRSQQPRASLYSSTYTRTAPPSCSQLQSRKNKS